MIDFANGWEVLWLVAVSIGSLCGIIALFDLMFRFRE